MKKTFVAGSLAVVAVFAGVVYFATRDGDVPAEVPAAAGPDEQAAARPAPHASSEMAAAASTATAAKQSVPLDPRLAALAVSKDNGLIEFVVGADGKVIKELDKDPTSPGFRKPLREYTYRGDQVVGLVSYKYLGNQVQTTRIAVAYKPDGSVDQYREATSYDYGKKGEPKG